jgi:hypothetical protein
VGMLNWPGLGTGGGGGGMGRFEGRSVRGLVGCFLMAVEWANSGSLVGLWDVEGGLMGAMMKLVEMDRWRVFDKGFCGFPFRFREDSWTSNRVITCRRGCCCTECLCLCSKERSYPFLTESIKAFRICVEVNR